MVGTGNGADGVSKITNEVAKVIAQVPPVVESLTGLRLDDLLARLQDSPSKAGPNGTAGTPSN